MALAIRRLKTKTIVSVAGLDMFVDEFYSPREMIDSLVALCEFAVTHPDFGKPGKPGHVEYLNADEATDALITFFEEDFAVSEVAEESTPNVEINYKRGTVELIHKRYRFTGKPDVERATQDVPVRLHKRNGASN